MRASRAISMATSLLTAFALYACGASSPTRPVVAAAHMADSVAPSRDLATCPAEMVLVEGEYCPHVAQRCLRWMDPPGKFHEYRCAEYAKPAVCKGAREHRRFCIDQHERTEAESELPLNVQSWLDAKRVCEASGARVCEESEWNFACEGEEMRPYPYGFSRDAARCNADQADLLVKGDAGKIQDLRAPITQHPQCLSPFGVHGMAGNVAEWVSVDGAGDREVVQKGAWWHPGKHNCRAAQGGHDKFYKGTETGFRCCKDAAR